MRTNSKRQRIIEWTGTLALADQGGADGADHGDGGLLFDTLRGLIDVFHCLFGFIVEGFIVHQFTQRAFGFVNLCGYPV